MVVLERSKYYPFVKLQPLPLYHLQEHVLDGPSPPTQFLPQHLRKQHLGPPLERKPLHSQLSHLLCCHHVDSTLKQGHVFGSDRRGNGVGHKDCEFLDSVVPGPDNPRDEGMVQLQLCLLYLVLDGPGDFLLLLGAERCEGVVLGVKLVGGKVKDVEPVVVPGGNPGLGHVLLHGVVGQKGEVADRDTPAALDDGLALAGEGEVAVEAVPHSELLGCTHDRCVNAVTHEHARFASPHKDKAVLALVDVDAGGSVEEADGALLAVGNLELLHVQLPGLPHQLLEPPTLQQEVFPPQLLLHEHLIIIPVQAAFPGPPGRSAELAYP